MRSNIRLLIIVGTRPQFLKFAPLSKSLQKNGIDFEVVHTGQHYDKEMSEDLFTALNLNPPDHLITKNGKTSTQSLANMMIKIEEICLKSNPTHVIVFGDCDSTTAGALVAKKLKLKLVHIEAGMRSYNKSMPEEINRCITDHISDLNLCATEDAVVKLSQEGIIKNVSFVGNLQLELLYQITTDKNLQAISSIQDIELPENFALLTLHREYNTTKEMLNIILNQLENYNNKIIFPIHPRTKKVIEECNITLPPNILLLNPVNYLEMTVLEKKCHLIITDSGGIQPEAWLLGKKCVIMRSETEWTQCLTNHNNILYDYQTPLNEFIENFFQIPIQPADFDKYIHASQNIIKQILLSRSD